MDWVQFILFMVAMLGVFWTMKSDIQQNRSESAADRRDMLQLMRGIQDEMKDFHGRLERLDAEFKSHVLYGHRIEKRDEK